MPAGGSVVAVASDGSALCGDDDVAADSLGVLLEDDAAGIGARAGLPVWAAPLPTRNIEDLLAHLLVLPGDTGAIFLTHTDPARARTVQWKVWQAGGPPVLTDADTIAVTLTTALLTTLARVHREPVASRVLIAGPRPCPNWPRC